MNSLASNFYLADEPYAGGFFEYPERSRFFRFAHAQRSFWEKLALPDYDGGNLYPCGKQYNEMYGVMPGYSYTFNIDKKLLEQKSQKLSDAMFAEKDLLPMVNTRHSVGGNGFVHSIPNYKRILKEGFNSYITRIEKIKDDDFRDGLLEVINGIKIYHNRALELLEKSNAPKELYNALKKVPFEPAETLYEAVVAWNFIYYMDGCDNPGRLDADLIDFYNGEDITELLREFFINVDNNEGYSSALGPDCNPLTLQCLKAVCGLRRPTMELRITEDTPEEIWDASADSLISGCGQPAFYNENLYQSSLEGHFPKIPKEDLLCVNGGCCTETMLAGMSNVGSIDAGINAALIFCEFMNENLESAKSFDEFYKKLIMQIQSETKKVLEEINIYKKNRSVLRPQPVRTLLIDDCIDNELDFNAGGARYSWSIVNVAGLINIIDSLLAIKTLVFDKKEYNSTEFLTLLKEQEHGFLTKLRSCPCFGVDDNMADRIASDFTQQVFDGFKQNTPYLGLAFLPCSIQFITYADSGKRVGATPDGRAASEPLCDSIGPVHGKDKKGLTALLNSAAKLPQSEALGTPVLNLRLQKDHIKNYIRPLILGYFQQGGMQVQISCASREDMLDAMEHPEKHENLIVRIGGYSEYFNRLSLELRQMVVQRMEHSI
ncbi:MAG: pyruvate formate lyase family protein [Eubacteriales bacterium]